jgi:hypothetical protein
MVVIKLEGGLGNQMFQYAFASIVAKKNSTTLLIDTNSFNNTHRKNGYTPRNFELSIFNNMYAHAKNSDILIFNNLSNWSKLKRKFKLNYPKIFQEEILAFSQQANNIQAPVYLKGYFQSYKYFEGFESYINNLFKFQMKYLSNENLNLIPILNKTNTIAIHIRRGDYVSDSITNNFHGICSIEYYTKAIAIIGASIKNPKLIFFSDDPQWVKNNFANFGFEKIFITHNNGVNSWTDMLLMSSCSHNIIANSSFSWWAAWLNSNPEKIVIAPKIWFLDLNINASTIDLIPESWIRI